MEISTTPAESAKNHEAEVTGAQPSSLHLKETESKEFDSLNTTEADKMSALPENTAEADGMSALPESTAEADRIPALPENTAEANGMSALPENISEADRTPELPENTTEADRMPTLPEKTAEADGISSHPENTAETGGMSGLPESETLEEQNCPSDEAESLSAEKKKAVLSNSLSQMSVARPMGTSDQSNQQLRARKNAAKTFLAFLLNLNVNRSATISGIITFLGLVMISIALHVLVIDLIGVTNVHERFDLPKWHEVTIELMPTEPPEPPKDMIPPRPQHDNNTEAAPPQAAESWPIPMRQPAGSRIARMAEENTVNAQLGADASTDADAPTLAAGSAVGRPSQTATVAGDSSGKNNGSGSGSLFDQDWSNGGGSPLGLSLGGSDGTSAETERTTGRAFPIRLNQNKPLMLRFYYQTFFQPDLLPKGEIRQKLLDKWTAEKYLDNISALEEILDNGNYADNETYSALLHINEFLRNGVSTAYRKRFIDLAEKIYGRFSFEASAAKVIILEQDIEDFDTVPEMERLKALPQFAGKDSVEMALIHRCFANAYVESKKFNEAKTEYEKCISMLEQQKRNGKVKEEIAMTQISLAALEIGYIGNYDHAQQLLMSVRRYIDESKAHPWMLPSVELLQGDLNIKRGEWMLAQDNFEEVQRLTENQTQPGTIWFGLGRTTRDRLKERLR